MTFAVLKTVSDYAISIHMPHTWHDWRVIAFKIPKLNFNPHATYVA